MGKSEMGSLASESVSNESQSKNSQTSSVDKQWIAQLDRACNTKLSNLEDFRIIVANSYQILIRISAKNRTHFAPYSKPLVNEIKKLLVNIESQNGNLLLPIIEKVKNAADDGKKKYVKKRKINEASPTLDEKKSDAYQKYLILRYIHEFFSTITAELLLELLNNHNSNPSSQTSPNLRSHHNTMTPQSSTLTSSTAAAILNYTNRISIQIEKLDNISKNTTEDFKATAIILSSRLRNISNSFEHISDNMSIERGQTQGIKQTINSITNNAKEIIETINRYEENHSGKRFKKKLDALDSSKKLATELSKISIIDITRDSKVDDTSN